MSEWFFFCSLGWNKYSCVRKEIAFITVNVALPKINGSNLQQMAGMVIGLLIMSQKIFKKKKTKSILFKVKKKRKDLYIFFISRCPLN